MRFPKLMILALLVGLLSLLQLGCGATRGQTGTLVGGGAGAAIGGGLTGSGWGALAGAVLGGLAGGAIGTELDRLDRERMGYALAQVPPGQPYAWTNPNTGAQWQMTPRDMYTAPYGQQCREYSVLARIGGEIQETYGTACLQPDGTWQVVS